jgi:hypothetical protein
VHRYKEGGGDSKPLLPVLVWPIKVIRPHAPEPMEPLPPMKSGRMLALDNWIG